jgi:hypothetical protein
MEAMFGSSSARIDRTNRQDEDGSNGPQATRHDNKGDAMSIHEMEEIKRSVGDVREWLKDQRFTDDDREPDSNINISIEQLNRALALMMVVEKEIERLRAERDEARWRLCKVLGDIRDVWGCEIAKENGWDYLATEAKP